MISPVKKHYLLQPDILDIIFNINYVRIKYLWKLYKYRYIS